MIQLKHALFLLVVTSSALVGATALSENTAPAAFSAGSRAAQTTAPLDGCALIQKADVDAAFAPRVFGAGEKGVGNVAGTAKLAAVSRCTFISRGATVRDLLTVGLLARRAPDDNTGVSVASAKDGAVKLNAKPVDVPGLGDAAYWVNLGSSSRPVIQLNVLKGKRLWLIFSASASKLDTAYALAGLTNVAKASLRRL